MITTCLLKTGVALLIIGGAFAQPRAVEPNQVLVVGTRNSASASLDAIYRELVSRRNLQISRLHTYATAGRFPRNTEFPGRLVPYFVDHAGTACAVGHLMRLDGQIPLVDRIAASCNHIRIEDVSRGPLVDWIHDSGLTRAECALIQPSYATIEDYRRGREWRDEQTRLQNHFARVEKTLQVQSQRSLGEALIAKLEAIPTRPEKNVANLIDALSSTEPNVRIAAAHLLARIEPETSARAPRIEALKPNLADPDPSVRFWTADALEQVGSAPSYNGQLTRGNAELHYFTLTVFLAAARGNQYDLRLPALIQLANIVPESINSCQQLRIVPEIRHTLVEACSDRDPTVRSFAKQVMGSWRWQRTAHESQRMRRHYLAESADLESLAAETMLRGRKFVDLPSATDDLDTGRSIYDTPDSITYFLPVAAQTSPPIAVSPANAEEIVDKVLRASIGQGVEEGNLPFWKFDPTNADSSGLFYIVTARRTDSDFDNPLIYILPRPALLSHANAPLHSWFKTTHSPTASVWPATPPSTIQPLPDVHVVLGETPRHDRPTFTKACDLFAFFLAQYAFIVVDREVHETATTFTWSGRFAQLRQYKPRFFEQGGGGMSVFGGGGWDFHQMTMSCDRATGALTLSVEPITFPMKPLPPELLTPDWTTEELKLMGWKPLESLDFFGDRLLPAEYHEVVENFNAATEGQALARLRSQLFRRWHHDKSLPKPELVFGLLYDRANQRETAQNYMRQAVGQRGTPPDTFADVARWELSIGDTAAARKHADAALKLWLNLPAAKDVLSQLAEVKSATK